MGHVPAGPIPQAGAGDDVPRRERGGGRAHRPPQARRPLDRRDVAALGEAVAGRFLVRRGARILARNLRVWPGEIDLLVRIDGSLVLVEVKTRVGGDPIEELTDLKAERLRRSGDRLRPRPDRYDLVAVRLTRAGAELRWLPGVC